MPKKPRSARDGATSVPEAGVLPAPVPAPTPRACRVTAIVAAHNEADVIGQVLADLVRQGVSVYLIDHASTDGTADVARDALARGLLGVESFPPEGGPPDDAGRYPWRRILERKQALAYQLPGDWFLHHDADELRESPWPELELTAAIARVDALGFNAVQFDVLEFPPTHDRFRPGDDLRESFRFWEPGRNVDRVQIKAWRRQPEAVDLVSTGGHEARFPGRRVFPLPFLLRHYPVRSQAHGERKVFRERRPRFVEEERRQGWHIQYDGVVPGHRFVRDEGSLRPFDPVAVRGELLLKCLAELGAGAAQAEELRAGLQAELAAGRDALARARADGERSAAELAEALAACARGREAVAAHDAALAARGAELERRLEELRARDEELKRARGAAAESDARALAAAADADRARAAHEATAGELAGARAALAEAGERIATTQGRLAVAEERLAATKERLAATEARLAATEARLAATEARLAATEGRLEAAVAAADEGRADAARLRSEVGGLRAERDRARAEAERTRTELEHAWAAAEHVRAELAAVYDSRSWRWSGPVRAALRRLQDR